MVELTIMDIEIDIAEIHTPILPNNWHNKKLQNVILRIEPGKFYKHEKRKPKEGEVGLLKTSAITKGVLDVTESKTIINSININPDNYIRSNDLLVCRANSPDYIGVSLIVNNVSASYVISDKIWRLHINNEFKLWVSIYLQTDYGRWLMQNIARGAFPSMQHMRQNDFLELVIPLPKSKDDVDNLPKACDLVLKENVDRKDINVILSEITTSLEKLNTVQ